MKDDFEKKFNMDETRLAWACRRGMLELDIILNQYLKEAYPQSSLAEKRLFQQLLSTEDTDLFAWLLGQDQPQDENMLIIVKLIRNHVAHSR